MSDAVAETQTSGSNHPVQPMPVAHEAAWTVRWKATRNGTAGALVLGAVYLAVSSQPVWHTDIWGHLSYGKRLWELQSLPAAEPLLPLAAGRPFVDTAWLSQIFCYGLMTWRSVVGLQTLTGVCAATAVGFLMAQVFRATRNSGLTFLAVVCCLWFNWHQFVVLRPELFGLVCFTWLFFCLTSRGRPSETICVPAIFLIWANLHGSFVIGIGLLICFTLGRLIDIVRRTGGWSGVLHDKLFKRFVLLTGLAVAATFVNPYGPRLYWEILSFSSNPNLQNIAEWQPLAIRSGAGGAFLAFSASLACLYRLTPRRIPAWEPIALIGLTVATLWSSRMGAWWTPVAVYLFALHLHAVWRSGRHPAWTTVSTSRHGGWSIAAVSLLLACFAASPLGLSLLRGTAPDLKHSVSEYTPLDAVDFLRRHPPQGQIFNVYEWGDYLQWAGPSGIRVFVNSHAHNVPRDVWYDYLLVVQLGSGWQETLKRHDVETIVMDRTRHSRLIQALADDPRWHRVYEDRLAVIFSRQPSNAGDSG